MADGELGTAAAKPAEGLSLSTPTRLLHLAPELLAAILSQPGLTAQDMLRATRVCKRLRQVVHIECDLRWRALCAAAFPTQPAPAVGSGAAAYRECFMHRSRQQRTDRKVALLKLRSDIQRLKHDLRDNATFQEQAKARCRALNAQRVSMQHALRVRTASGCGAWVPSALRERWDVIITSQQVDPTAGLAQVDQDLAAEMMYLSQLRQQKRATVRALAARQKDLVLAERG